MKIRLAAAVTAALCGVGRLEAVVIDDFTTGVALLATDGSDFDQVQDLQLVTSSLALERRIDLTEGGRDGLGLTPADNISIEIDASEGGRLRYEADGGLTAIQTFVGYSTEPVDLTASGENTLVFEFEWVDFPAEPGFLDLFVESVDGSGYTFVPLRHSPSGYRLPLQLSLLSGFDPTAFTGLRFGTANGGLAGSFSLASIATEQIDAGDYNADGRVDAADYTVWRDTLGRGFYATSADGDGDGTVTELDYGSWVSAYSSSGSVVGVPEPGTLASVLVILSIGRKGRSRPL